MKVSYDPDCDGLRILFSDAPIERSIEEAAGLILDYDNNGILVGLEMTDASHRIPNPRLVEFAEQCLPPQSTEALSPTSEALSPAESVSSLETPAGYISMRPG